MGKRILPPCKIRLTIIESMSSYAVFETKRSERWGEGGGGARGCVFHGGSHSVLFFVFSADASEKINALYCLMAKTQWINYYCTLNRFSMPLHYSRQVGKYILFF